MAFSQFDLVRLVRCPAVDDEGFQCGRPPGHGGGHRWARCEATDAGGHRCMLPPGHPGGHEPPWYDRDAAAGDTHELRLHGTEKAASALADRAALACGRYGWAPRSRHFAPSRLWRWRPLAGWLTMAGAPRGVLTVVFEYRPGPKTEGGRASESGSPEPDTVARHRRRAST